MRGPANGHGELLEVQRMPTMNAVNEFKPHRLLRNAHLMTIAATLWKRKFPQLPAGVARLFDVEPGTQVRGECHWQAEPRKHPTIAVLHGLEGSSDSGEVLGTAEKAWMAGFNVVRLNQRNCGATEGLTETLYHSGLSCDIRAVTMELIERDGLPEIFPVGFSMGGNLVLKMAGELGDAAAAQIRGFVAVAPPLELAVCADALADAQNFVYQNYFVRRLKERMRRKAELFPRRYALNGSMARARRIRSVREFDEVITAPFCGFRDADDYYTRSSSRQLIEKIRKPTLILTAQDDPFVPFHIFDHAPLKENRWITLLAPRYGGHCGFVSGEPGRERFWAEARVVEFCAENSQLIRNYP
jgi:uncharacterized protein